MLIAEKISSHASGHKTINVLDGNARYNQIFMVEDDLDKTAFPSPDFVGFF
jgi:hypothetical protein